MAAPRVVKVPQCSFSLGFMLNFWGTVGGVDGCLKGSIRGLATAHQIEQNLKGLGVCRPKA